MLWISGTRNNSSTALTVLPQIQTVKTSHTGVAGGVVDCSVPGGGAELLQGLGPGPVVAGLLEFRPGLVAGALAQSTLTSAFAHRSCAVCRERAFRNRWQTANPRRKFLTNCILKFSSSHAEPLTSPHASCVAVPTQHFLRFFIQQASQHGCLRQRFDEAPLHNLHRCKIKTSY